MGGKPKPKENPVPDRPSFQDAPESGRIGAVGGSEIGTSGPSGYM